MLYLIILTSLHIGLSIEACQPVETCSLQSCIPRSNASMEVLGELKSSCETIFTNYSKMCVCSDKITTSCTGNECKTCVLQFRRCSASLDAPPCCPIANNTAKAFCNANTGMCEAYRYACDHAGSICPFDDLSVEEIKNAISIVKNSGKFGVNIQFPIVRQQEPKKSRWNAGLACNKRVAYVAVFDLGTNELSEVLIDLTKQSIIKRVSLPNTLPPVTDSESVIAATIALSSPEFQEAIVKRNLNINYTKFGWWALGALGPSVNLPGKRLLRAVVYYQLPPVQVQDWTAIPTLIVTVDLNKNIVDELVDVDFDIPLAPIIPILSSPSDKPPLKPLIITQNEGSSIKVMGQQIEWYKWKMHYNVDPIFGLQFHHIRYEADCEERLIIYKLSLGELYSSYGAKGTHTWRWKNVFDCGQYGIGKYTSALEIGRDVPENSILFNCILANETGAEPKVIPGCVAAYERDSGMLYRHSDMANGFIESRRGRQLVLTFVTTIGNYDYIFDYVFNMDGIIEVKIRLTGIFIPQGVKKTTNDPTCLDTCNNIVNDYILGAIHQHFISYRIDFDVDGINNYVEEVDLKNERVGPENPDGGAFSRKIKILEHEGHHDYNLKKSRTWHVVNSQSRNKYGSLRGYVLRPGDVAYTRLNGNAYLPQAMFVKHPMWATVFKDHEQTPIGWFPRTGASYDGLPKYIKDRESLKNADAVLWYTFGITHSPRPEEWPIMNAHTGGFTLVPYNFLSQNSEISLEGRCR